MKRAVVLTMAILGSLSLHAQILKPVKWSYAAKKLNNQEAIVMLKATIEEGWHIYSQQVEAGGPVATLFTFQPAKVYQLIGPTNEPKPIMKYEDAFGMNVKFFEESVVFQQRVKLHNSDVTVKGKLEYMVCNDHQCLPPEEVEFSIQVK